MTGCPPHLPTIASSPPPLQSRWKQIASPERAVCESESFSIRHTECRDFVGIHQGFCAVSSTWMPALTQHNLHSFTLFPRCHQQLQPLLILPISLKADGLQVMCLCYIIYCRRLVWSFIILSQLVIDLLVRIFIDWQRANSVRHLVFFIFRFLLSLILFK